ncbi:MAG: hypothetical protein E6J45_10925 [Chloroflexi bacterium]|nr:MAG: hypothetical protein E6J45_10925 [Chloroflexota bacterium]
MVADVDLVPVLDVPVDDDGEVAVLLVVGAGVAVTHWATPWIFEKEGPLAMKTTAPTMAKPASLTSGANMPGNVASIAPSRSH